MRLTHNIADVTRALRRIQTDVMPFATMLALNDTANDAHEEIKAEMGRAFDQPTRWTLNAFMVWRADKRTLRAEIRERPSMGPRHYLKVQSKGGSRPNTGLEKLLQSRLAYAGQITAVVPASGARKDRFGNWSSGERNQALSSLKAQRDATANTTAASRVRRPGRAVYFVPKPGSHLSPGIYRRERSGVMTKVAHFTGSMPSYRKRIDFHEVAYRRAGQVYDAHFRRRFLAALRTSR